MEIHPQSTAAEIKKSYRRLAHQYHPDKGNSDVYREAYFLEIKEAYETLIHPQRRAAYDEERWLSGAASKKQPVAVSAEWILRQSAELAAHVSKMDTYRMRHELLAGYIQQLLSKPHLAILIAEQKPLMIRSTIENILKSIRELQYGLYLEIIKLLRELAANDPESNLVIDNAVRLKNRQTAWARYKPWIILFLAFLICLMMVLV